MDKSTSIGCERVTPWLPDAAVDFLEGCLPVDRVFEFGAGASTGWFQLRCFTLHSVDHDPKYAGNSRTVVLPRPYNQYVERYPDEYFDLVLVDGRDRVACVKSAARKTRMLVLDNSERPHYAPCFEMLAGWNRIDFYQRTPDRCGYTYPGWRCTIWKRPER